MKNQIEIVKGRFGVAGVYSEVNQPTHAVVTKKNHMAHGDSAVAISHHWSEEAALQAARIEQHEQNEPVIVIAFEDKAIAE